MADAFDLQAPAVLALIQPFRVIQPPHRQQRADETSLQRAYKRRKSAQLPASGIDPGWWHETVVGAVSIFVFSSGMTAYFGFGWLFMAPMALGGLLFTAVYLFDAWTKANSAASGRQQDWASFYRDTYWLLTATNLPLLLTEHEAAQLVELDDRESLKLSEIGEAKTVYEAMLRLARNNEVFLQAAKKKRFQHTQWVGDTLTLTLNLRFDGLSFVARARYAAIYDFLFQPQEEFHKEYDRRKRK